MEIAIVLDCSNVMKAYVDRFKTEIGGILKSIKQKHGKLKVALVKYIRTDDNTDIKQLNFTEKLHKISELIPYKYSTEPKSVKPTDVHTALGRALDDLNWTMKSSRRMLILIAGNPPHGKQYHKMGSKCDKYENGTTSTNDLDIMLALDKKQIHFYMISVHKSLYQFMDVLSKIEATKCNLKYVHHIDVNNENEMIEKIQQSVFEIKQNVKQHEERKMSEERVEEDLLGTEETKETDSEVDVGQMKWIYNEFKHTWCPVLILSTKPKTATVWDGGKHFTATIERLKERKYDNEAMPIFRELLQSSFKKYEALERERKTECREIQRKISSNLKFNSDVKWLQFKFKSWHPVLVIQRGPKNVRFVLDRHNKLMEVTEHDLKDQPPCENELDIAACVSRLNNLCSNYSWKSPIGAQCCWKEGSTMWTGKDIIRTGIIESIQYLFRNGGITYNVRPEEAHYTMQVHDDQEKFEILDATGYKSTISNSKKILKSMEDDIKRLKSQLETKTKKLDQLKREKNTLKNENNQFEKKVKSLESDNYHLRTRITKNKRDIESKTTELQAIQEECHKAITMKQDTEKKFKNIVKNFDDLKEDAEKLRKQKKEQQQLVNKLRDKKIENSAALDLSRGFPPIQDIVRDFGLVKSQYHVEAAKLVKKILKKKNQNYSKLRNYKIASNMLFDILMDSFEEMKKFQKEQYQKMANGHDLDDANQKKIVEKNLKEKYLSILNEVKTEKARKIVNQHKKLQELDEYLNDDNILLKYAEECVSICWVIVLVGDPNLTIEPEVFDQSGDDIEFDELLHIEGFGSDTEYCLNFVIWPSIVRQDTDYNISKVTGVFIEDIPKWNKKYMKKMKAKKNTKKEQQKSHETEQKNEDNMINGIDEKTPKTTVEKENNYAPDECADDKNDAHVDGNVGELNDIEKDTEKITPDTNENADKEYVHVTDSNV